MLEINNQQNFAKAIAQAVAAVAQNPQGRKLENWVKQIARATFEIENNPFMHYDDERQTMIVVSSEVYEANGVCQCRAAQNGLTCWHRIAKRIWQLYLELEAEAADEVLSAPVVTAAKEQDAALYIKSSNINGQKVEKVGGIRL